jgi:hypothetical protein
VLRTLALASAAALTLCAAAGAMTPAQALARTLKANSQAYYGKQIPGLKITTVTCKVASNDRHATCKEHFTVVKARAVGVFTVSAAIDPATGGVQTKTTGVSCKDTKTGKAFACFGKSA